tara:strand:+ start:2778 stop:3887 length:1110 start_codon:yes stop_codon:yes gene_type:complete
MNKKISVIGIGRLGLVNSLCFESKGYNVLGYDINKIYVEKLNQKNFQTDEPYVNEMLKKSTKFKATCDINELLKHSKFMFIIINTPKIKDNAYSHIYLNKFINLLNSKKISDYHLVISCSVRPGYFQNKLPELLKDCNNIKLSYNPQFVQQALLVKTFLNPDMILIGEHDKKSGDEIEELFKNTCNNKPKICRMSPQSAEICKFSIATFVTSKISFANFIGEIADSTKNADKFEILNAVGLDSRVGNKCLKPGWGYGGVCFPRDNQVLIDYANKLNIPSIIPKATHDFNEYHAEFLKNQFLNDNLNKYTFTDVAFKPNSAIPLIEESHKLKVAKKLYQSGKKVVIKDREKVIELVKNEFGDIFDYEILN